jgi:hypothetical protein
LKGAAIYGCFTLAAFLLGLAYSVYRRDGAFTLRALLRDPPAIPPLYIIREVRRAGIRTLKRPDLLFLIVGYALLGFLLVFAAAIAVLKNI